MTEEELTAHFNTYTEQIPRLIAGDAFWALLHYIVIFPDICAALESDDGRATGAKYEDWANRYLATENLSGEEWYDMRCLLLHQGRTLGRRRYVNYEFTQPNPNGFVLHRNIARINGEAKINLDVNELAIELQDALRGWIRDIASNLDAQKTQNVINNIPSLSRVDSSGGVMGRLISGANISATGSFSTNS